MSHKISRAANGLSPFAALLVTQTPPTPARLTGQVRPSPVAEPWARSLPSPVSPPRTWPFESYVSIPIVKVAADSSSRCANSS